MNYKEFISTKTKSIISSGFDLEEKHLNENLKDFQKHIIKIALKKGRFALFEDCGLGKTIQQLEWAYQVSKHTQKKVLILAPLAVVAQTKKEAEKFNIDISNIDITNYEQLKNLDATIYSGVVLDESSILKGRDGKLSRLIIDTFSSYEYKLACSATPSPNDHLELGQHVEFLGYDTYENMKSMFFVQDQKIKSNDKWRLKKHAHDSFWIYVCQWSLSLDNPKTLGFDSCGYDLPEIEYIEHIIKVENLSNSLFNDAAVSATDLHRDLKRSLDSRIKKTCEIVNGSKENFIVWTLRNNEADALKKVLNDSVNVQGSDKPEFKAEKLNGFANNEFKVLITKTSIASFGMNYQNCANMVFSSYDFKFEAFYQAVRRCYRFGQTKKVKVHILIPETQKNVRQSILKKQKQHKEKQLEMSKYSQKADYNDYLNFDLSEFKEVKKDDYWVMCGDSIELSKSIETNSIDYMFFSPPFKDLYTYSDDPRDLSNVGGDKEFYKHFSFLIPELYRALKSGRLLSMHIMQGTTSIGKDGFYSIVDFRGELIRLFQSFGFLFHAEKMIRKSPQIQAVRTKNRQIMYGNTKKDSSISRCGLADYIITFRKQGKNEVPIESELQFQQWCEMAEPYEFDKSVNIEHLRKIYDPLWLDIEEGDVISGFRNARGERDEKHLTPTQLPVIQNCIELWSNEGETVFSPFGGVGSEGYQALKMNRKSISIELKESYFNLNVKNHELAIEESMQKTLF